ncbi:hypothetical protein HYU21_04010 [Candidatus Woesearchaeota archaeon]|nr:hypothetical protein [Candidatus Woesearchaeota archaeon]
MAKILYFPQTKKTPVDESDKTTDPLNRLLLDLEAIARHLNEPVQRFKKPEDYTFLRRPYLTRVY